ncbi:MAG: biosynthetic-type acetolactate synthase large subunit [Clostridiales bacterium]|nr:biosynthetic-type acetolactate synthase large subunit [Clostridiales bacterium]
MQLTGAQILMECLLEQNVEYIFGLPGGQIMPVYDALYDYQDRLKHVLTCHEQGAVHAADGYARSTGKVGVCFATSGPGATNTVTGIATAYMDSVPIVIITGQVPVSLIGKDSFQETDIVGITLPITKHNYFVNDINDLVDTIRNAFEIARSGRPGPVLIDIPKNIQVGKADYKKADIIYQKKVYKYNECDFDRIVGLINNAKKPVIFAGGGVIISEGSEELFQFANKTQIPVLNTLMGLGSYPRTDKLSLGIIGMHGFREANLAMDNSDLIIAIGARFSDRVTGDINRFAKNATIIHIDIDESEVSKNVKAHYGLIGDIKDILSNMIPLLEVKDRHEWIEEIKGFMKKDSSGICDFIPENIFKTAHDILGSDTLVTTEVGQHQMWTAQYWPFMKPRTFITSGGLGTMGYGFGAAIGTQVGNPDKTVLHVAGDGSFRMNLNELATVAHYKLPIITLLMKNNVLGMVRQWQTLFFQKRYSSTDLADVIDYVKLADAFGIKGVNVNDLDSLRLNIEEAYKERKPRLIVCDIDCNCSVFPIVPPGEAINNQRFE